MRVPQLSIDRVVRGGLYAIVGGILIAVLGSVVVAVVDPAATPPRPTQQECGDPPCLGGDGFPGPADLPMALSMFAYGIAALSGVPVGILALFKTARRSGHFVRLMLPALGPLLVLMGTELIPHVVNLCFAAHLLDLPLPAFCTRGEHGVDVIDRLHLMQHTVFGAIPLGTAYWLALRRWYFRSTARPE